MKKRKCTIRLGDVIEIPLSCGFAYVRIYNDCAYGLYRIRAQVRPSIDEILFSGIAEIVTVFEGCSENGTWPVIGRDPFLKVDDGWPPAVRYARPGSPNRFIVQERGQVRPATTDDMDLPIKVKLTDSELIARLDPNSKHSFTTRSEEVALASLLYGAMSIDRNDVAERVAIEFNESLSNGATAEEAVTHVISVFGDAMDDSDFVSPFWLALADLALRHECLTDDLRNRAIATIGSEASYDVVESWSSNSPEEHKVVRRLRQSALEELAERLERKT